MIIKFYIKLIKERILRLVPDTLYIYYMYWRNVGYFPNIKNPTTFSEKIQWLKLHNQHPDLCLMVDKHLVKEYVANIIGSEYIIPTLAVWNNVDEIDLDCLPNQFVLKWNHDSGSIVICKNKEIFDLESAKNILLRGQYKNGYWYGREWPYKNVKPVIIAECFMKEESSIYSDLVDYKFFCFNGEPLYCQVIRDRSTKETIDFYDMNWIHQDFVGLNPVACNGLNPVARPQHLECMMDICRKLSNKNPFVRVDLYEINDKVYFGEITFFPASGFGLFAPEEWNKKLGDLIDLNYQRN